MDGNLVNNAKWAGGGGGGSGGGRPNRRWLDNIKNNLSETELSGEETQDRVKWSFS